MDIRWTIYEKRTDEVLDITVDWEFARRRLGEDGVVSAVFAWDPTQPGDATIATGDQQPRLEGTEAICRIEGGTQDGMLLCTATFSSGQVEIDKTLIKWIP